MGKFLDTYRQLRRLNKQVRGRKKYLEQFPWYYGEETEVIVTDAMNLKSDKRYKTTILDTGSGHSIGLKFALAGRQVIKEIKCPKCGKAARLNIHWQGFQCSDAMWEIIK